MLLLALGLAAVAGVLRHASSARGRHWAAALLSAAAGAAMSLALMVPQLPAQPGPVRFPRPGGAHTGLPVREVQSFAGTLLEDSTVSPEGSSSLRLRLSRVWNAQGDRSAAASGQVLVRAPGRLRLYRGQQARVEGGLSPAASAGEAAFVSRARAVQSGPIGGPLVRRRAAWLAAVEQAVGRLDPEVSALLGALLLGSRSDVSPSVHALFQASGTLHLLALSGLHVGILYAALWGLLRVLPWRGLRRLVALAGVAGYVFLIGTRPSLLRAAVMLLAGATGAALDREADPLNLLSLAAAAVLLLDPWRCADLGCQLSFLSLAGICVVSPVLARLLARWLPGWLGVPLAVSVGAQVATLPLLAAQFGVLAPAGFLASALLIPVVSVFLWAGLAALPLCLLGGPLLTAADAVLRGLYALLRLGLELFARIPLVRVSGHAAWWGGLAALMVAAVAGLPRGRQASRPAARAEAGA